MSAERNNTGFATVKKLQTNNGFWKFDPSVKLGQQYMVDLDSRGVHKWRHKPSGTVYECETIEVLQEDGETWKKFPTELLEI